MRRVRGVVHGPAAGVTVLRRADDRPARRPSIGCYAPAFSCLYSPECVGEEFSEVRRANKRTSAAPWRLNQLLAHPKRLTHRPHTPNEHEDPQQKR